MDLRNAPLHSFIFDRVEKNKIGGNMQQQDSINCNGALFH